VIAKVHNLADAEPRNIGKHCFKRCAVAMDIGDRGQCHHAVLCPEMNPRTKPRTGYHGK
jgi:hypothetical protein